MKQWKNFETNDIYIKEELRVWLKRHKIYAEISECYDGWHFEIKMLEEEAEKMIWFLESIINMINGEYE